MLEACLRCQLYDAQVEVSRASWLVEILDAATALTRILPHVVESLDRETDPRDLEQQCEIARVAAARGDPAARRALYGVLDRPLEESMDDVGEAQVIRLDGIDGLLHVARRRGARLRVGTSQMGYWFESAARDTEKLCGAKVVAQALERGAQDDPDIRTYRDALAEERGAAPTVPVSNDTRRQRLRDIPAAELIRWIVEDDPRARRGANRPWGRYARPEDLLVVQEAMLREHDPCALLRFLAVFTRCALARFDARVLEYAEHADPDVRWRALRVLGNNTHESVRRYALERLSAEPSNPGVLGLLARNYARGDERWIEAALIPQASDHDSHDLVLSLLEIYGENPVVEGGPAMLFAYEETPCTICREDAVRWLAARGLLAEPMREECRLDANQAIRDAATIPSA